MMRRRRMRMPLDPRCGVRQSFRPRNGEFQEGPVQESTARQTVALAQPETDTSHAIFASRRTPSRPGSEIMTVYPAATDGAVRDLDACWAAFPVRAGDRLSPSPGARGRSVANSCRVMRFCTSPLRYLALSGSGFRKKVWGSGHRVRTYAALLLDGAKRTLAFARHEEAVFGRIRRNVLVAEAS